MGETELTPTSCPGPHQMTLGGNSHVCAATGKQEVLEKRSGLWRGGEGPETAAGRGLCVVQVSHGLGLGCRGHPKVLSFETRGQQQPGFAISTHSLTRSLWGKNQKEQGLNS